MINHHALTSLVSRCLGTAANVTTLCCVYPVTRMHDVSCIPLRNPDCAQSLHPYELAAQIHRNGKPILVLCRGRQQARCNTHTWWMYLVSWTPWRLKASAPSTTQCEILQQGVTESMQVCLPPILVELLLVCAPKRTRKQLQPVMRDSCEGICHAFRMIAQWKQPCAL